jgi:hypothetical protein
MSGFFTPGLPAATTTSLTAVATVPVDTNLGQGIAPQSVAATPAQLIGLGQGAPTAITYAAAIAFDASTSNNFSMTFGAGNATLTLSNMQGGQIVTGKITQDGTGSRILTVAAGSGGATLVSGTPLSTGANKTDLVGIKNIGTTAAPQYLYYSIAKDFA